MNPDTTVIYARFSSDMQRPDSCDDQVRNVRRDLPRHGVDPSNAVVLRDEAESGTKAARSGGFEELLAMIRRGEVAVLAVDDQSRLSRADNAFSFVQDLVFAGGRFVSTGEGIDTAQKGWELRVKVMELHNSHTVRELAARVRRGRRAASSTAAAPATSRSATSRTTWTPTGPTNSPAAGRSRRRACGSTRTKGPASATCSAGSSPAGRSAGSRGG